jgi:hypothetical protein
MAAKRAKLKSKPLEQDWMNQQIDTGYAQPQQYLTLSNSGVDTLTGTTINYSESGRKR